MKKIAIVSVLLIVMLTSSCQYITGEVPSPVPTPEPGPERGIMFDRVPNVVSLYGVRTEINLSFTNEASEPRTISPFPPEIKIIELPDVTPTVTLVRAFPLGTGERALQPGESASYSFDWDQKNDRGEQVPPGWYSVEVTLPTSRGSAMRVLVLPPEGVMEKTIEVNQSKTMNGITFTLERVELTATGIKVYAFNTPPDYNLPQGPMLAPPQFMALHADAEYSVDGGDVKQAFPSGIRFLDNGMEHTWDEYLDPVPQNSHELTFRITKLGDWEGPWEFEIPLDEDTGLSQDVTVSKLVAQANSYNDKVVALDAFYFYAVLESNTLADSFALDSSVEGKVVPVGAQIRVKGYISQELHNQLYTQESPSPTNTEYFGKLRITGKFEIDDTDGEYQIDITSAEVLEWMLPPPQAGAETPAGNLQIKISGFSDMSLQGAEVVSFKQPDGQLELRGLTDADGTVTFDDIKQGGYEFTVSLADYIQMNIKLTVTGGRTADVAFHMAHTGEAPDDLLPAPGMGPQYRANMTAVRRDGTHVVNPWPPITGTTVTFGASTDAVQINYRDYITTEAGQVRNNMFFMYRPGSGPADTSLNVILKAIDPPSGITVTQNGGWSGPATQTKAFLKIEISQNITPGEYVFSIDVQINGEDYGTVPCTIKVTES